MHYFAGCRLIGGLLVSGPCLHSILSVVGLAKVEGLATEGSLVSRRTRGIVDRFGCGRAALWLLLGSAALPAVDAPRITAEVVPAPATAGTALAPNLTVGPDGTGWLTWLEKREDVTRLQFSEFDANKKAWAPPRTIASGQDWYAGASDFPPFTVGENGRATALWYVTNPSSRETAHLHHGAGYHAVFSRTGDGGQTWSAPKPLARNSDMTEFAALATLADGRVLAVWLDARAKKAPGAPRPPQQLYSRILGAEGPDTLVDAKVCDCCQTSLTAFPDGSALLAYRGRSDEEVRDIRVARFRDGAWQDARTLSNDDWRIAGCPVNGPQIASDGGRVAAAWFTAADNDPRVQVSISPDAGGRFLMPIRVDESKPAGRVSTILLHDSAILVTWVDAAGALRLRRTTPDFVASQSLALTTAADGKVKGFPRAALWRDYMGGTSSARIFVAYTAETAPELRTLLIDVPEGALFAAEQNCDCGPTPEELAGFSIRGTIDAALAVTGKVRVKHFEVPGIFAEGPREFRVDAKTLAVSQPGRQFLARIEKRNGEWWLLDPRFVAPMTR